MCSSMAGHSNYLLKLLSRELSSLTLNARKGTDCSSDMIHLDLELGVKGLDAVLHGLIQLLETLVDLATII